MIRSWGRSPHQWDEGPSERDPRELSPFSTVWKYSEKTRWVQPRRGPSPALVLLAPPELWEMISVFDKAPSFGVWLEQPEMTDRKALGKVCRQAATGERTGSPFRERALAAFSINNGAGLEAHGNCPSMADTILVPIRHSINPIESNHRYSKIYKEYTWKDFIMKNFSPIISDGLEGYSSSLVWITPEANPETMIWVQVVYLGDNSGMFQ